MLTHHNQNEFLSRLFFSFWTKSLYAHTHTVVITLLAGGADILDGLFVLRLQSPIFRCTIWLRNSFMKSDKQGLDRSHTYQKQQIRIEVSLDTSIKVSCFLERKIRLVALLKLELKLVSGPIIPGSRKRKFFIYMHTIIFNKLLWNNVNKSVIHAIHSLQIIIYH